MKYRIISPENFPATTYMKHGESKVFEKIPDWAINNPHFVIEKIEDVVVEEVTESEDIEDQHEDSIVDKKETIDSQENEKKENTSPEETGESEGDDDKEKSGVAGLFGRKSS